MIRSLLLTTTVLGILTGCGLASAPLATTRSDEAPAAAKDAKKSEAKSYNCADQYMDRDMQDRPLWEETFEATVTPGQDGITKTFGYSPGNGKYMAWVGPDGDGDLALMIRQEESGIGSTATATELRPGENATVIYHVGKNQFFVLSCSRK